MQVKFYSLMAAQKNTTAVPNNSFKPTLLHGGKFFQVCSCSIAAVQQGGLTQALDR